MAAASSPPPATVVPAQLGFLAIYNPSLGTTDDTIDDQIVYYASVNTQRNAAARRRTRSRPGRPTANISPEERNERLRQIGLAQGMVEFSRGFAGGKPADTIETVKSRVVLHELEPGWWILASIDLTKLPLPPRLGKSNDDDSENVEYSSREVKPAALLLQDLLRAHSIFLLHHAASLSALFVRSKRSKFVAMLSRYWDLFLSTWNVMLHGNPACAMFGGINIAACGQLGIGVGEEDRGSGEREVLEGFVGRMEGLVDLVVSKFGEAEQEKHDDQSKDQESDDSLSSKWLGTGEEPGAEDGAIFLGVGALSRHSLRDLTYWMEDLYTWGEDAYGVKDSPTSTRLKPKRRKVKSHTVSKVSSVHPNPNTPSVGQETSKPAEDQDATAQQTTEPNDVAGADEGGVNKLMSYLKMGYGTHWTIGSSGTGTEDPRRRSSKVADENAGHYLIGLKGDVEETGSTTGGTESDGSDVDSRTLLRTLTVELESEALNRTEANTTQDLGSHDNELSVTKYGDKDGSDPTSHFDSQDRNKTKKVRVVVYVSKPFIYTFIFQNRTDSLAWDSLYRSLHYQLAPLRKPLTVSTSYRPYKPDIGGSTASHIFDLVWDPWTMTINSTIPSIPDPVSMARQNGVQPPPSWTRVEALNTHIQILNTFAATRKDKIELERTCKTSRGWWVVWTRMMDTMAKVGSTIDKPSKQSPEMPLEDSQDSTQMQTTGPPADGVHADDKDVSPSQTSDAKTDPGSAGQAQKPTPPKVSKEIFLIRRAGEHGASGLRGVSGSYGDGNGSGWAEGAGPLAQGIGVDTKKYVEDLLALGR